MSIAENWQTVTARIRAITSRPVAVVAVAKTQPIEAVQAVIAAGARLIGENRIEEVMHKYATLHPRGSAAGVQLHMIGHVQSRKAGHVAAWCDAVQSLDSAKLADTLESRCAGLNTRLDVLLEINISGEPQKYGVAPADALALAEHTLAKPHLRLCGLMTMAPLTDDTGRLRRAFAGMRSLRDALAQAIGAEHCQILSMGMTNDYLIAVEEGSTMVRIGRALFAGCGATHGA
jgi:hypothetical protein